MSKCACCEESCEEGDGETIAVQLPDEEEKTLVCDMVCLAQWSAEQAAEGR